MTHITPIGPLGWERVGPLVDEYEQLVGERPWSGAVHLDANGKWRIRWHDDSEEVMSGTREVVEYLEERIRKVRSGKP